MTEFVEVEDKEIYAKKVVLRPDKIERACHKRTAFFDSELGRNHELV